MQPSDSHTCPVCGRNLENAEKCSFCGALLTDQNPATPARREDTHPPQARHPWEDAGPNWGTPPSGPSSQPWHQGAAPAYWFAGFWIRVVANLVDSFILQILLGVFFAVGLLGHSSGSEEAFSGDMLLRLYQMDWSFLVTIDLIVGLAYFTIFLGSRGQTPGKMLLRLKVIRTDGSELSYPQALLRTVGYYLVHYFTLNLGFLWVVFHPRKQGLHDKLAQTYEIRLPPASVQPYPPHPPGPMPIGP